MNNVVTRTGRVVLAAAAQVPRRTLKTGATRLERRSIHSSAAPRSKIIRAMSATVARRSIHSSGVQMAQITVEVPTMGDSITEGTIVEWCVPPGSHVKEGDVIAMVETDKVTIDIKADQEGVLIKHLGEVDETVEVGHGLYVLDTDVSAADSFSAETVSERLLGKAGNCAHRLSSGPPEDDDGVDTAASSPSSTSRTPSGEVVVVSK